MTADPLAVELARTRAELRRAEDELAELRHERVVLRAQLRDRGYVDVELPEQRRDSADQLAATMADAPMSILMAAMRQLGMRLTFDINELEMQLTADKETPA